MMQPVVGIALGAGGARGFCHIGVLKELQAMNRAPDVVSGASSGAVMGACYAAGRLEALEDWARSMTRIKSLAMWDLTLSAGGLIQASALETLFRDLDLPDAIEDLDLPFACVATDMVTGAEIDFTRGSLFDAIRASIAFPGFITPHHYQDRWLLDGGLVNPIPVSVARSLGAQLIISSNPNARLDGVIWRDDNRPPDTNTEDRGMVGTLMDTVLGGNGPAAPGMTQVIWAAIEIMSDQIQRTRLAGDPPHVQLNGTLADVSMTEMHAAERVIEEGHRMVQRQREFIEALASN